MSRLRRTLKSALARTAGSQPPPGVTLLTYHRVGGPLRDELDVSRESFAAQVDLLARHRVVALDHALDALGAGSPSGMVVLTFDDGFRDLFEHAWPLLRDHRLPFTLYLASAYVGGQMRWEGATARDGDAPGLTWDQVGQMADSGLCTLGNHTHHHVPPQRLSMPEIDQCTQTIRRRTGHSPVHFAYPWGVPVPRLEAELRTRFRSAATGRLGRNTPGCDPMRLARVPVRRTDPPGFFRAKLVGSLGPERAYAAVVSMAKAAGARA